jgi:deoxyadenosine/deoxycytidine kinase
MYIAVSGNLGSGKSTIARGLASEFNCQLYPRSSYDTSYIEDLYREPERWTTEAQISFMVHKHDAIREGMERGRLFVIDRTFSEEVRVFAERFYEDGTIETRSIELIRKLATDLEARLAPPDLIVFCNCPVEVCEQRLQERPRSYQSSYPPDHLRKLDAKLQTWLGEVGTIPVMNVNTVAVDYSQPESVRALARDIDVRLTGLTAQLDLFAGPAVTWPDQDSQPGERDNGRRVSSALSRPSLFRKKMIYLAAPFTNRASKRNISVRGGASLFSGDEFVESIPRHYRNQLLALARAIERHGFDVLLPHRDINRWGSRALPASQIASRCLTAIESADAYIGLIGNSFGSHTELGYALGMRKPCIILLTDSLPTTFFGLGMATMGSVPTIKAQSLPKLIAGLKMRNPMDLIISQGPRP